MLIKKCEICGKVFEKDNRVSMKIWLTQTKFCSRICMGKSKIGNTYKTGIGYPAWNKGKPQTKIVKEKLSKALKVIAKQKGFGKWMKGRHLETYKSWKGEKAGYGSKHDWVVRWQGKPTKCEHCGKDGLTGKQIHWANKDHKYKRKLEDWLRLCAKCHGQYDKEKNLRH